MLTVEVKCSVPKSQADPCEQCCADPTFLPPAMLCGVFSSCRNFHRQIKMNIPNRQFQSCFRVKPEERVVSSLNRCREHHWSPPLKSVCMVMSLSGRPLCTEEFGTQVHAVEKTQINEGDLYL